MVNPGMFRYCRSGIAAEFLSSGMFIVKLDCSSNDESGGLIIISKFR